ncbi:MAG: alpha-glucan family phosphorylase [Deltaproteobacteria bacterium]|nr:alpha-glucan family phosphorylase [Deltaproteobacteria bacterium]
MPFSSLIPDALPGLNRLLSNFWWTWNPGPRDFVRSLDPNAFDVARGSSSKLVSAISARRWRELSRDASVQTQLAEVVGAFDAYMAGQGTWWQQNHADDAPGGVAYFSAEFGVHESLPIYSGGLGVLAGDHVKSASDLGVPFTAVGLFYRDGYFRQTIRDGAQWEDYIPSSHADLGLGRALGPGGQPLEVYVPMYDRYLRAEVFEARVGRVRLLLLDTDVSNNIEEDRWLTRRLYGGDRRTRICQEVVLGIGGLRAIRGLGMNPNVLHLNEGHTAFVLLERYREEIHTGCHPEEAWERVRTQCVFTTHTPVPAGHDRFDEKLLDQVLGNYRAQLGLSPDELMDLGREQKHGDDPFCMTVIALEQSRATNGVSAKHGEVSRQMWRGLYSHASEDAEVPIGHITNGVHAPSWLGAPVRGVLEEHLGKDVLSQIVSGEELDLAAVPDQALWDAHQRQKQSLVDTIEDRLGQRIDEDALLLGFARRFAPYKRGDLLLSDFARACALMTNKDRPVYLLYAGKSHPRDKPGKEIIERVVRAAGHPEMQGHVIFLPNYEIDLGRSMTQGVDVWINNPRRPLEASGTSGQKVSMNGGLNCSTLDGWWLEGYESEPLSGWGVGDVEPDADLARGDAADAEALYSTLEDQVVPLFYDRVDGLPADWIRRMKRAIATCLPAFNTDRMVADYVRQVYLAK